MARICIPVCASNVESLITSASAASAQSDLVELRLDYLTADEFAQVPLEQLKTDLGDRLIVTLRDPKQGGQRELLPVDRRRFWQEQFQRDSQALFDIELDTANSLDCRVDWTRVICSHHDFDGVPDNLDHIYERISKTESRVIKIAVSANDVTDCLPVFKLLERAGGDGREIISIAMGNAGIATRILGPSRGGFLTYAASELDRATAPGQLTADQSLNLYRIKNLRRDSPVYGLIGLPAMHSVSPHMHNASLAHLNLDGVYIPFEVKDAPGFLRRMVHPRTREIDLNVRGLSVTAPHKVVVMEALDWIDDDALEIGACNTITVDDGRLLGYNTDASGFLAPLLQTFVDLRNLEVAVIGAGGAASAVVWALRKENAKVTVFARDEVKARSLPERFGVSLRKLTDASFRDYDLLVNTTPLGSNGEQLQLSPASVDQLRGVKLVYDLVYNPIETVLLKQAREAGCRTITGLEMLVAQAALQFELWTGKAAPVDVMRNAGMTPLSRN